MILTLAAAAAAAAAAQEPPVPVPLNEITVTASRTAGLVDASPFPVAVIPEERLIGRDSVADALTEVADVYVQAPSGRSGLGAVFVRGGDPNFTTVLLDGVPLNNPANILGGSVNVSELSAAGIERVEVVAGPLSSLYGSGALAGVINLVVPGGAGDHRLAVRGGIGTASDVTAFGQWRGPLAGDYGASLAASHDDAGDVAAPARFRTTSVVAKLAPLGHADAGRLIVRAATTRSQAFPEASGGERFAVFRDLETRRSEELIVGASQPLAEGAALRFDVSGSLLHRRDRTETPGVAATADNPVGVPGGTDATRYRRLTGQGVARYAAGGWQAVAGIEAQSELARSTGELALFDMRLPSGFRGDRATYSGFVEASRTTVNWVISGGARVDRIDGLGTQPTLRAGVRYAIPGSAFAVRASAGTGFKAPSFYALGNPFVGNPELGPERSRAIEAGVTWTGANGASAAITAFRTRYAGLIDFVPEPVPRLENRGVVIAKGVSLAAARTFGDVAVNLQGLYVETRDRDTGERLLNRPRWRSGASIGWAVTGAVTLLGRHSLVGQRLAFSVPTGTVALGGYQSLAIEAAWTPATGPNVRLIADNALDGDNEDAVGFIAPGRRLRLLIGYAF